jgi:hypothetical protein
MPELVYRMGVVKQVTCALSDGMERRWSFETSSPFLANYFLHHHCFFVPLARKFGLLIISFCHHTRKNSFNHTDDGDVRHLGVRIVRSQNCSPTAHHSLDILNRLDIANMDGVHSENLRSCEDSITETLLTVKKQSIIIASADITVALTGKFLL